MRALLVATLLASSFLAACSGVDNIETSAVTPAGSAVRIETSDNGVGSGVYIGNDVIITAAHVVGNMPTVKIKSDIGDYQEGSVLWVNKDYDLAAVKPRSGRRFKAAYLSCKQPRVGEAITAKGNPVGLEFVTMRGFVSGEARTVGAWKSVFLTDLTTYGGMSGGPIFDNMYEVVGITVGVVGFSAPTGGLGFAVPGDVVCQMLGRA